MPLNHNVHLLIDNFQKAELARGITPHTALQYASNVRRCLRDIETDAQGFPTRAGLLHALEGTGDSIAGISSCWQRFAEFAAVRGFKLPTLALSTRAPRRHNLAPPPLVLLAGAILREHIPRGYARVTWGHVQARGIVTRQRFVNSPQLSPALEVLWAAQQDCTAVTADTRVFGQFDAHSPQVPPGTMSAWVTVGALHRATPEVSSAFEEVVRQAQARGYWNYPLSRPSTLSASTPTLPIQAPTIPAEEPAPIPAEEPAPIPTEEPAPIPATPMMLPELPRLPDIL